MRCPADFITALLKHGFNLFEAARSIGLPPDQLVTLIRDPAFRSDFNALRALIIDTAHLAALTTLQRLIAAAPAPAEQRRAARAILGAPAPRRARPRPQTRRRRSTPPSAPARAQCPLPNASSSQPVETGARASGTQPDRVRALPHRSPPPAARHHPPHASSSPAPHHRRHRSARTEFRASRNPAISLAAVPEGSLIAGVPALRARAGSASAQPRAVRTRSPPQLAAQPWD